MGDGIEGLKKFSRKRDESVFSVFRQAVTNGAIKVSFAGLVTVELKEHDLQRIHDIIHEVDDARAFYNPFEDEIPKYVLARVRQVKEQVHLLRRGVWANAWAREVVQRLLHELGDFITRTERNVPERLHDPDFGAFEEATFQLRLRVWTIIAHLVAVFGNTVKPLHLPPEILSVVKETYEIEQRRGAQGA